MLGDGELVVAFWVAFGAIFGCEFVAKVEQ